MQNAGQQRFKPIEAEELPYDEIAFAELRKNKIMANITKVNNQYIMYARMGNNIRAANVTRMIEAQEKMILIFIVLLVLFSVWTYFLSLLFVKSSLGNIKQLVDYVKHLDIHNLDNPVPLLGPINDEIHIIWSTLQKSLNTIKEQTDSLKDFVTHASHELKTPLMSLNSIIDAGEKTGDHQETYTWAKKVLHNIGRLFETLVSITKREYHHIQKKDIDIVPIIHDIQQEIDTHYNQKQVSCTLKTPDAFIVNSNEEMFRIIFFNLLQNAYKYTPEKWTIHVKLHDNSLSINNSWPGISLEHIKHIWEKFWKNHHEHASKEWFGLGLYLVKLLVGKHCWTIDLESEPWETTTFTLSFTK